MGIPQGTAAWTAAAAAVALCVATLLFAAIVPWINRRVALGVPMNADAVYAFLQRTNPQAAIRYIRQLSERNPSDPFRAVEAGIALARSGDRAASDEFFSRACELFYPKYSRYPYLFSDYHAGQMCLVHERLAESALLSNNLDTALVHYRYARAVRPSQARPIENALEKWRGGKNLAPEQCIALARYYLDGGNAAGAKAILDELPGDPPPENLHLTRALLCLAEKKNEAAQAELRLERDSHPENLDALALELPSPRDAAEKCVPMIREAGFRELLLDGPLLSMTNNRATKISATFYDSSKEAEYWIHLSEDDAARKDYYLLAQGDPACGIGAVARITVTGEQAALLYVSDYHWRAYRVRLPLRPGDNEIRVHFLNNADITRFAYSGEDHSDFDFGTRVFRMANFWWLDTAAGGAANTRTEIGTGGEGDKAERDAASPSGSEARP